MNAQVLGVSVDHVPCLKAWATNLGGISFPLLSDFWPHGDAARAWGVFREEDGHSERAIFLVDREGVIRYVDVHDIADQPDNDVIIAELERLEPGLAEAAAALHGVGSGNAGLQPPAEAPEPVAPAAPAESPSSAPTEAPAPPVLMYCRTWCPDCRRARAWLDERGIAYTEIDVDADADARQRAMALNEGRLHTPTFEIGESAVCVDFREEVLRELLGL